MKIKMLYSGLMLALCFSLSGCANANDMKPWSPSAFITTQPGDAANTHIKLLHLTANVDGSGRFIFTGRNVRYEHKQWSPPANVAIDDRLWNDLSKPFPGWKKLSKGLNLSRAWIVERHGRDVIALEPTPNGFDLYLDDSPNGSADYEVTIAIPTKD
jgi:hypothetical protein